MDIRDHTRVRATLRSQMRDLYAYLKDACMKQRSSEEGQSARAAVSSAASSASAWCV